MDNRQFIEDYKEAFGEKATLPIAFWHSDTPVAVPEQVNGCFFPAFEKVRDGQPVSFDSTTMKCGGGKFYCGLAPMPEYVPTFVSEKEHYKASPALVKDFVERLEIDVDKHKYLNFQRLDLMDDSIEFYGVLIFATPDILSGLVSWAYYDNSSDDAVCTPWGSGCSTTIRQVIIEMWWWQVLLRTCSDAGICADFCFRKGALQSFSQTGERLCGATGDRSGQAQVLELPTSRPSG